MLAHLHLRTNHIISGQPASQQLYPQALCLIANSLSQHPNVSMYRCQLLAINMRHMNAAMHVLLSTNEEDDILCIQEPWFSRIGVQ